MASSLFRQNNPMAMIGQLQQTVNAIKSGNADAIAQQMAASNPQFGEFCRMNAGKSAEQILQENGLDIGAVNSILGMLK